MLRVALFRVRQGIILSTAVLLLSSCAAFGKSQDPKVEETAAHANYRELMSEQRSQQRTPFLWWKRENPQVQEKVLSGDRFLQEGDLPHAVWSYLQALRIEPENATPHLRLAHLHLHDDPEYAASLFAKVAQENSKSADAQIGLGLAYLLQNQAKVACSHFERALELTPNSVTALSSLALAHDQLGQHTEAQDLYRRVREQRPQDVSTLNNLGISLLMNNDFQQAETSFREAVAIAPSDTGLRNNLGLALGLQERYAEALAEFRTVGSEQAAQNNLGYVYSLNRHFDRALKHYELALLAPGNEDLAVLRNVRKALEGKNRR